MTAFYDAVRRDPSLFSQLIPIIDRHPLRMRDFLIDRVLDTLDRNFEKLSADASIPLATRIRRYAIGAIRFARWAFNRRERFTRSFDEEAGHAVPTDPADSPDASMSNEEIVKVVEKFLSTQSRRKQAAFEAVIQYGGFRSAAVALGRPESSVRTDFNEVVEAIQGRIGSDR